VAKKSTPKAKPKSRSKTTKSPPSQRAAAATKRTAKVQPAAKRPTAKPAPPRPVRNTSRPSPRPASNSRPSNTRADSDSQMLSASERALDPGDSGLNQRDLEMFKQMLLEKRAELVGDVNTLHGEASRRNQRDATGNLSSMPIHMADLGTDNYELEFTLGLIEGERAVIREIDEALERIDNGTYGICAATGKAIGKARLKAKPWAKFSYEYTLAQEQGRQPRL
jgi:DnaK suppressor protein